MENIVLVVVVVLGSLVSAQDNQTTLHELFEEKGVTIHKLFEGDLNNFDSWKNFSSPKPGKKLTLAMELLHYIRTFESVAAQEVSLSLGNFTVQSIYENINANCSTNIDDDSVELKDTTCVEPLLRGIVTSTVKRAIEVILEKRSRDCVQEWPTLCSEERRHCTTGYEDRVRQLLTSRGEDLTALLAEPHVTTSVPPKTLFDILLKLVRESRIIVEQISLGLDNIYVLDYFYDFSKVSLEPFAIENLVFLWKKKIITESSYVNNLKNKEPISTSRDKLTWGVVRSNVGVVEGSCSNKNSGYGLNETDRLYMCLVRDNCLSYMDLISCVLEDVTKKPLTWISLPNIYIHSPCLCVAFNGNNCGVHVDLTSCLPLLLKDFQRRITHRPAVTYLDYSLQTRIPFCNFTNLLSLTFRPICYDRKIERTLNLLLSVRCFFTDLVNKDLNCSKILLVESFNHTELCGLVYFIESVLCEEDTSNAFSISYYGVGDSTLVLFLTYVDVASRAFTLLSYLACPLLQNLPQKLMICYLMTSMLRPVVVRALLDDLQWAVRLDVFMDLASTFWLTAYLHILTISIKTLRAPNSLKPSEARQALIRYALFGWVFPLALSATFFCMDEFLDSRVQFGQLLFVLCNYSALLANLYMFYYNFSFYYFVNSILRGRDEKYLNIFARLFKFAFKTSVLSGAGITIRLILTQIQGLEHVLGYYHVVGTFQGLLLFMLYGCNLEARGFWLSLFRRAIGRCNCCQNTSEHHNSLELADIPATEGPQNCSSA